MAASGVVTAFCGGGVWVLNAMGTPSIWLIAFGVSGIALATIGTSTTAIQLCHHISKKNAHYDW